LSGSSKVCIIASVKWDATEEDSEGKPSAAFRHAALVWTSHIMPELHIQDICDLMRKFFQPELDRIGRY
jgi:hypothetical protein